MAEVNQLIRQYGQMKKMMSQMSRGSGMFGGLGKKMLGGLAGGLGGGLGGLLGGGGDMGLGDDDFGGNNGNGNESLSGRIKKKKRHKKRK